MTTGCLFAVLVVTGIAAPSYIYIYILLPGNSPIVPPPICGSIVPPRSSATLRLWFDSLAGRLLLALVASLLIHNLTPAIRRATPTSVAPIHYGLLFRDPSYPATPWEEYRGRPNGDVQWRPYRPHVTDVSDSLIYRTPPVKF